MATDQQVADLEAQVAGLQSQITSLNAEVVDLETRIAAAPELVKAALAVDQTRIVNFVNHFWNPLVNSGTASVADLKALAADDNNWG